MFSDIKNQSSIRFVEVREYLDFIKDASPLPPKSFPRQLLIAKGMFFVHLYAAFEFTIRNTYSKAITFINSESIQLSMCKKHLYCLVLNPELDALNSVSNRNWKKRWDLFEKIENNIPVFISNDIFPTDGKNIKYRQLESIWKSLCVPYPLLNTESIGGRINEIVEMRNSIAHGNISPIDIGSSNTIEELYNRYNEVSNYCSYFIDTIEEYIRKKDYLEVI
ncbi:MAG: hypothetical protein F9K42_10790 [Ignavibacterium sp.]|nr:MAG: hypothetical protein F9K42_10790 [Ignavibacterium sp.]